MAASLPKHSKRIGLDALLALGTAKAYLMKTAYVFSAAHKFVSDLGANVLSAVTLANVTTDQPNEGTLDCDDITWSAISGGFAGFWIGVDTGTGSTSPLIYYNPDTPVGSLTSPMDVTEHIDAGVNRLFTWGS